MRFIYYIPLIVNMVFFVSSNLYAQTIANAIAESECEEEYLGKIVVVINEIELVGTDWWYPFELEYKEVNTGATDIVEVNQANESINNLPSGEYELTLYLDEECVFEFDITIPFSSTISMIPPNGVNPPSDCNSTDGGFVWHHFGEPEGGIPPYNTYWTDIYGTETNVTSPYALSNVPQGVYTFHIEDSYDCHKSYEYELTSNYQPVIVEPILVSHSCEGLPNGEIGFFVFPNNAEASSYNFNWSNGEIQLDEPYTYVNNLTPGNYTVTITDISYPNCSFIENFAIEDGMASTINLTTSKINSCANQNNGKINMMTSGGIAPYYMDWYGSSIYSEDGYFSRSYLSEGQYCFTITDQCDEQVSKCVTLTPIHATHNVTPNCASQGNATIIGLDGNPPYTYLWPDGETTAEVHNKETGDYNVTIADANDCVINYTVPIYNRDYEVEEAVLACEGASDGVIIVRIYNPFLESASVLYNGIELDFDGNQVVEELSIGSLTASEIIEFDVSIGNCSYSDSYELGESPTTHEYVRTEDYVCYYDIVCKGEMIVPEGHQTEVQFEYDFAEGGVFEECNVPFTCDGNEVGKRKYSQKWDKGLTYLRILESAWNVHNSTYIQSLISSYHSTGVGSCDRVKVSSN